jgi:citrate synthase
MDAKTGANIKSGSLKIGEKSYNFPIYDGTIGPEVIDISKLYAEAGIFTYDPGFTSTGSCESKITYIDGDEGVLLYRGYPTISPSTATSSRPAISCCTAICRPPSKKPTSSTA